MCAGAFDLLQREVGRMNGPMHARDVGLFIGTEAQQQQQLVCCTCVLCALEMYYVL